MDDLEADISSFQAISTTLLSSDSYENTADPTRSREPSQIESTIFGNKKSINFSFFEECVVTSNPLLKHQNGWLARRIATSHFLRYQRLLEYRCVQPGPQPRQLSPGPRSQLCREFGEWEEDFQKGFPLYICVWEICEHPSGRYFVNDRTKWVEHQNKEHKHWFEKNHANEVQEHKSRASILQRKRKSDFEEGCDVESTANVSTNEHRRQLSETCRFCKQHFKIWDDMIHHYATHLDDIAVTMSSNLRATLEDNFVPSRHDAYHASDSNDLCDLSQHCDPPVRSKTDLIFSTVLESEGRIIENSHGIIGNIPESSQYPLPPSQSTQLRNFERSSHLMLSSRHVTSTHSGTSCISKGEVLLLLIRNRYTRVLFENIAQKIDRSHFIISLRNSLLAFRDDLESETLNSSQRILLEISLEDTKWLAGEILGLSNPHYRSSVESRAVNTRFSSPQYLTPKRSESSPRKTARLDTVVQFSANRSLNRRERQLQGILHETTQNKDAMDSSPEVLERERDWSRSGDSITHLSTHENVKMRVLASSAFKQFNRSFYHLLLSAVADSQEQCLQGNIHSTETYTCTASAEPTQTKVQLLPCGVGYDAEDSSRSFDDPESESQNNEERIIDPEVYFKKLYNLQYAVYMSLSLIRSRFGIPCNDKTSMDWCLSDPVQGLVATMAVRTKSRSLLRLLECSASLSQISKSLVLLMESGYCATHISILVVDPLRKDIAKLIPIKASDLLELDSRFQKAFRIAHGEIYDMQAIGSMDINAMDRFIEHLDKQFSLTSTCSLWLDDIGISCPSHLVDSDHLQWQCVVQILELGILSYAGAHTSRYDLDFLKQDSASFEIPRQAKYENDELKILSASSPNWIIRLRRRKFKCLDQFLGKVEPWVFEQKIETDNDQFLSLSSTIENLTDLWGPSWKIVSNFDASCIQQYNIGNGAIVPWPKPDTSFQANHVGNPEISAHWVSFKEWEDSYIDLMQSSLERKHFFATDTLLIGASNIGLAVNLHCGASLKKLSIKTRLDQQGALRVPKTFRSQRYADSHAVQVQGSAMGFVTAAGMITYKRRNGHTMKDALIERWRHNLRNPVDLEAFGGVEISLCTRNARRQRLLYLLGSPTVRNYLLAVSFSWNSSSCERSYFEALKSPRRFRMFWRGLSPEDLLSVGDAITICLEALAETGTQKESQEMRGLWVDTFDNEGDSDGILDDNLSAHQTSAPSTSEITTSQFYEEWIVALFRSEHSWTGFLEDSEESLSMAVLDTTCLDFDYDGYGRRCSLSHPQRGVGYRDYPVLQTSIQLNMDLLASKLKQKTVCNSQVNTWDAKDFKKGMVLSLGDHGSLKVLTVADTNCPLIMEWTPARSDTIKEIKNVAINEKMLGKPKELHHREYIRGKWEIEPMPILLLSPSNKDLLSKFT